MEKSSQFNFPEFLDWMLSTLTYVIRKCQWKDHKETLMSVGNALIELILSFHREGTYSFMGLTITRDCIICLNHVLYQMQINLNKNVSTPINFFPFYIFYFISILIASYTKL